MLKALIARLKQGFRTGKFPPAAPNLPPDFRGRPQIDDDISPEEFSRAQSVCPVKNALFCDFEGVFHLETMPAGHCKAGYELIEVCRSVR